MPYPPQLPPSTRTDATISADNHASDHNKAAAALAALIAELGTNPSGAYANLTDRLVGLAAGLDPSGLPEFRDLVAQAQAILDQQEDLSGIDTSDGVVSALVRDPDSDTAHDLSTSFVDLLGAVTTTSRDLGINPKTGAPIFSAASRRRFAAGAARAAAELGAPLAADVIKGLVVQVNPASGADAFAGDSSSYDHTIYYTPAPTTGQVFAWAYPGNDNSNSFPTPGTPLPQMRMLGGVPETATVAFSPGVRNKITAGGAVASGPITLQTVLTGHRVTFRVAALAGAAYRIKIDGNPVTRDPVTVAQDNHKINISWTGTQTHEIRIEGVNVLGVLEVYLDVDGILTAPPLTGPTIVVVGDSWTVGAGADVQGWTGMVQALAAELGCINLFLDGAGSTGYSYNAVGPSYLERQTINWPLIEAAVTPDLVIDFGSQNDQNDTVQHMADAATSLLALQAPVPILIAVSTPSLDSNSLLAPYKAALRTVAANNPSVIGFLDMAPLMTAENQAALRYSDGAHPSQAFHTWMGRVEARTIRALAGLPG